MRRLLPLVLFAVIYASITARDDTPRLRVPTADEYVAVVAAIAADIEQFPSYPASFFFDAVHDALFYLYPDTGDIEFDALRERFYTAAGVGDRDLVDRWRWVRQMVVAKITEDAIDLSQVEVLTFEDFYITVTPRDFDADGTDEFLLDIAKGKPVDRARENCLQVEVIAYLVAQPTAEGYRFIDTNVDWRGHQYWGYSGLDGGVAELGFEDINADGLPEWIVVAGGERVGGPGMGYANAGSLIVLGWRAGGLTHVVSTVRGEVSTVFFSVRDCNGPIPLDVTWDFTNIDDDDALEILQSQEFIDNWACQRTETKVFDWKPDEDRYAFDEERVESMPFIPKIAGSETPKKSLDGDYAAATPCSNVQ
ncbi:MAG: hypothetical protein IPK52_12800 [Chloroflexi bacterium]|nr:hypothetical protein [Chloroflexota bacterium]